MKNIKVICITGGTCAGKTQTFEALQKELLYNNLKILYLPESGTSIMQKGVNPSKENVGLFNFQLLNLQNQLMNESLLKKAAECMNYDNVLIICDRSSYEQQVFIDRENWLKVLDKVGVKEKDLLNSYDAVFHLVSTAIGAEFAYGILTNKNRIHTIEEAREQELIAQKIWNEHPYFKMFDNSTTFEVKKSLVINEIRKFITENFKDVEEVYI